jgi:subtilisin-like proprotein convertase family protein
MPRHRLALAKRRSKIAPHRLHLLRLEDRLAPSNSIPLSTVSWTPIGPAPINSGTAPGNLSSSGRTSAVFAHPTDANILYVGAASGGVWKTTNATAANPTWTPLTDNQAVLTTGDIALAPSDPNIVYVATGEPNNSGDSYYGRGVLKSTDGGATWTQFNNGGVFDRHTMSRVVVHPTDPNIVFVAVQGSGVNGLSGNTGVYRSTNGGTNWTNITSASIGTSTAAYTDFEIDPTNQQVGYCAVGSGGGNALNGIYKTTNLLSASPTWSLFTGTTTGTSNGRTLIAMAPSNSQVLYVVIVATSGGGLAKFYQTTDGGANWIDRTATTPNFPTPQGSYDVSIRVDPSNSDIVVGAGASSSNRLLRTTNGGASWSTLIGGGNGPHVDHHAGTFDALGRIIDTNDGGVYRLNSLSPLTWVSLNGVATTPNRTALQTNQFAGIAISPTNANLAIGGTQDNGTQRFNDSVGWSTVDGGDGGDLLYDPFNSNTIYRVSPVGSFGAGAFMRRSTNGGLSFSSITTGIVNASSAQFYPPIIADPSTPNRIFLGTNVVNVTTNGTSWAQLGAALPSTSSIRSLGIGAASTSTIYVGSNSNNIYVTTDNGATWNLRTPLGGDSFQEIGVDPTDSNIAYVVSSTFTNATRIWRTTNAGVGWTSIQGDLPNLPTYTVQLDPGPTTASTDDVLYIGNDVGVFRSVNFTSGSPHWARFGTGLPNVIVRDLEFAPTLGILAAGTYGRGVWEILTTPSGPPSQSISGQQFNDQNNNGVHDGGEPGLPGWTVYLDSNNNAQFEPVLSGPTTFNSTNVPLPLPDLATTTSTLTTSGLPGVVTKVTVTLNITHTFDGDLVVDLIGPGGQTVNLFTSVGGAGQNFTNTTLDDAAATPISGGSAPFSGSFSPQQLLAGLNGSTPNGTWTLRITDVGPQDVGTLNSWSIRLTTGEDSKVTDQSGNYQFSNLAPGTYTVREVSQPGWLRTLPVPPADSYAVTITAGGTGVTGRDFGVFAAPPAVTSVVIDDNTTQRSRIASLKVVFSDLIQYVGSASAAFTLSKQAGGTVALNVNTVTVGNHSEAMLTFLSDTTFGSLNDGRYTLTVNANQVRSFAGVNMTADSTTSFHRYYGDANGDAAVDIADFGMFSGAFNTSTGQTGFLAYFDYDNNGTIDILDFGQFSIRIFIPLP